MKKFFASKNGYEYMNSIYLFYYVYIFSVLYVHNDIHKYFDCYLLLKYCCEDDGILEVCFIDLLLFWKRYWYVWILRDWFIVIY